MKFLVVAADAQSGAAAGS